MPIQVLECPSCGGNIEFYDQTKLFGRCISCGREVQRTEPEKIIVQGNLDDSNQVIKQGMGHLELEHFDLAQDLFNNYIKKNPKRYEGYYGLLLSATWNFNPRSLDFPQVVDISKIENYMRDIEKTADPNTVKLIRERLDQYYSDYKQKALREISEQIESNEKKANEITGIIDKLRSENDIEFLQKKFQEAKKKRETDLKKLDRKIAIARFFEKKWLFFLWLIIVCIGIYMLKTVQVERDDTLKWLAFNVSWIAIGIAIPVFWLKWRISNGSSDRTYLIEKLLKRKKAKLSKKPLIPSDESKLLDKFIWKNEALVELKKKNEELRNEASEESKMDIERLVFYRTVDRKFKFHK